MAEIQIPDGPGQGKTKVTGDTGPVDSFNDDMTGPKDQGPKVSHPGPGNGSGSVPLGEKLRLPDGGG